MERHWRERGPAERLAAWDALASSPRGALPKAGLPEGIDCRGAVEAPLLVAQAKGLLRLKSAGADKADVQVTPRGAPAANAIAAFSTGLLDAWSHAVRAVDAIEPDPDPEATLVEALSEAVRPLFPTSPQPLLLPRQTADVARHVLGLDAEVRNGRYERKLVPSRSGNLCGIAWFPVDTPMAEGFDPSHFAEWGTTQGGSGCYLPARALPDLLLGLCVMRGAFFIAETHDGGPGPAGLVMPSPGHERQLDLLNDMRAGKPVSAGEIMAMLGRFTAPPTAAVQ